MTNQYLALRCWLLVVGCFIAMAVATNPYSFACFLVSTIANAALAFLYEREMKRGEA